MPAPSRPSKPYPLVVVQYDTGGVLRVGTGDEYPIQALAASGFAVLGVSRPIDYATSIARAGRPKRRSRIMAMRTDRASVHDSLLLGIRAAEKQNGIDRDHIAITGHRDGASAATYAQINYNIYSITITRLCCNNPQITYHSIVTHHIQYI